MLNLFPQFNRATIATRFISRLADRSSGVPQALETTAQDALTHFERHAPKPQGPVNRLFRTATLNAVNTL